MTRGLCLAFTAMFYTLLGLWWHIKTTKRFQASRQKNTQYTSNLTLLCCSRCRESSCEAALKLVLSVIVIITAVYQHESSTLALEQRQALCQIIVFSLFVVSALCDILFSCCPRITFPGLDYMLVVICFNGQSVALAYHTDANYSWITVANTCAMYASTGAALALLLEFKYTHIVWIPLGRAFMTFVLGTWCFHIYIVQSILLGRQDSETVMINANGTTINEITELKTEENKSYPIQNLYLVPMHFSWHFLFDLTIMTILWLVVCRMSSKHWCLCVPSDEEEVTHFENRVHFDYHMVTRMTDSDCEDEQ